MYSTEFESCCICKRIIKRPESGHSDLNISRMTKIMMFCPVERKKMKEKSWVWCVWYWGNHSVIFVTNVQSMPLYCVVHSTADGSHVMVYGEKLPVKDDNLSCCHSSSWCKLFVFSSIMCVCSATNKPLRKKNKRWDVVEMNVFKQHQTTFVPLVLTSNSKWT